jgi:two-component system OmpR family sensor kinase/two-component system sensor histidine kinase BaeS
MHLPIAAIAVWICLFVMSGVALRRVGGPVGNIVGAAHRLADGDYSTRIVPAGPRFVRAVAGAFNTMADRLEAQDRQRRELMADIAHELRTPLTVIQGRLEGLLDGVYARDEEHLAQVLDETRVLARLVEDLRTLANAETGILTLQKEPTDVSMLIRDAVNAFSGETAGKGVAVRVAVPADLPMVSIDPLRIREVLINLLSNALRFTPPGGVVSIDARSVNGAITVTVKDTGPGIAAEDLPKIFERFYKGRSSRGSGLGLTIARKLVVAHGGSIRAESEAGAGAAVMFTLPRE